MSTQPEALRLAEDLEIDYCGDVVAHNAAAELRRLVAQHDLLVRVLKDCEIVLRTVAKDDDEFALARHQVREIRAAIKAVEGEST